LFPSADDAARFFTTSAQHWPACSNRQFHHTAPDDPDEVWTAGQFANTDNILNVTETREGPSAWACQRAMTASSNIVIDVAVCVERNPAEIAVNIARQIAAKVDKQ
jgi:hypothetical protein